MMAIHVEYVMVLDQDTVTIGRLSARNTTSFLLLVRKTLGMLVCMRAHAETANKLWHLPPSERSFSNTAYEKITKQK